MAAMGERLRITDVVRVPLRELAVVGEIEPAWSPGSVNRVLRGGGAYVEIRTDAGVTARELERLNCYWLEEPLPRYAFADLARLTASVDLAGDGCMAVPTGPGLGVSIDPDAVA